VSPARAYLWLITLLALGVLGLAAGDGPSDRAPSLVLAASLLVLGVLALHFPLELGPQHKIDVSLAVYVADVLSFSPAEAVVLVGATEAVGEMTLALRRNPTTGRRRRGPRAILFNIAQLTVATWLAAAAYTRVPVSEALAIPLAAGAMYVTNFAAVQMMLALGSGAISGRETVSQLLEQLPEFVALCSIGIVAAFAGRQTAIVVWLMALPTAAVHVLQGRAALHMAAERLARLEAERAQGGLQLLVNSSLQLATSLNYDTTLRTVAGLAVPALADWCLVSTLVDAWRAEVVASHIDPALGDVGCDLQAQYMVDPHAAVGVRQVLATRHAELYPSIPDALLVSAARNDEHLRLLRSLGLRCAMVVPLMASDRLVGAISLYSAKPERHYGPDDLVLAEELASRCALAIETARLYGEQRAIVSHLRQLSDQLGAAQREQLLTDERHRIAYELHDRVEQAFFGIGLNVNTALDSAKVTSAHALRNSLLEIRSLAIQGAEDLRASIFTLTNAEIHDRGLVTTLWPLVRRFRQSTGLEADLVVSGAQRRVAPEIAEVLYAVAREGLANVEQHAHASVVIVSLRFEKDVVTLTVQDDGVGASQLVLSAL
jgi:signal transduction histidine kinase